MAITLLQVFKTIVLAASTYRAINYIKWGEYPYPFTSSQTNGDKAYKNYKDNPVQRYVATALGDEIPKMRDDLIRRKNNSEGFIERHWHAWTTSENWTVDPDNDWFISCKIDKIGGDKTKSDKSTPSKSKTEP